MAYFAHAPLQPAEPGSVAAAARAAAARKKKAEAESGESRMPLVKSSIGYGIYLAVSSNLRYQVGGWVWVCVGGGGGFTPL